MMKHFRIALCVGCLGLLLLTVSGCVFIRLLKVKGQMREFDRYVRVEDQGGLALIFLQPVMLMKDVEWLMRSQPTIQAHNGRYALWKYAFKKQYQHAKTEEGDFDITGTMFFENGKLYKIKCPKQFSSILARELIIGALKSMSTGKIDKQQQSISAIWEDGNSSDAGRIPVKQDVEKVLGQPFFVERTDSGLRVSYKYKLQPRPSHRSEKLPAARIWLTYRRGDGRLVSARSKINGMTMSIHFPET